MSSVHQKARLGGDPADLLASHRIEPVTSIGNVDRRQGGVSGVAAPASSVGQPPPGTRSALPRCVCSSILRC